MNKKTSNILIILYFIILFILLIIKYKLPIDLFDPDFYVYRSINILPFYNISRYLLDPTLPLSFVINNIVGNIILFIPMGLFLKTLNYKDIKVISITLIISLSVEIIQYTFMLGASDIDDIILNAIGGIIGIKIFNKIKKG